MGTLRSHLDDLVARSRTPGLQYVAVDRERTIVEYAGGCAARQGRAPVDAATTMMAYSMSKTITAAAVLRLVEAGKVSLDASIAEYLEGMPYPASITVRQLLSHTSGIPN